MSDMKSTGRALIEAYIDPDADEAVWVEMSLDEVAKKTVGREQDRIAELERQRDELVEVLKDVDVSHDNNGTDWLYSCRRSEDEWMVARDKAIAKAEKDDE